MIPLLGNPRFDQRWGICYLDRHKVYATKNGVAAKDITGETIIPVDQINVLMLGPGTTITHKSIERICKKNTTVIWAGENGIVFYAVGTPCNNGKNILQQAKIYVDPVSRVKVAVRMFEKRFGEVPAPDLTIQQLRGYEGQRMQKAYASIAESVGIEWKGRSYQPNNWQFSNDVNKALTAANACLYGLSYAAIVAFGLSPAIGFIHTGNSKSFVFDIADLFKTEISIPIAFESVKKEHSNIGGYIRHKIRDVTVSKNLLSRIIESIEYVLGFKLNEKSEFGYDSFDGLETKPIGEIK